MKRCVRALFLNPVAKSSEGMFTPNCDRLDMASVLVTGGAGFIGTHLCRHLHRLGHHVISLDINHLGEAPWECVTADIRDSLQLEGIDAIVHLAAQISVPRSIENPDETLSINVDGTSSLLTSAEAASVKKILFASSAAVMAIVTKPRFLNQRHLFLNHLMQFQKLLARNYCVEAIFKHAH